MTQILRMGLFLFFLMFTATSHAGQVELPPLFGDMRFVEIFKVPIAAPDADFTHVDGTKSKISDFRGKVVLLNFWATWCGPCVEEMPSLDALQKTKGGDDFAVLAVSMDLKAEDKVKKFFQRYDLKNLTPYINSDGSMLKSFDVSALPTSFIIGRDGNLLARFSGSADWVGRDATRLIEFFVGE